MVKVSIRGRSRAAHFDVVVLADSPKRALSLMGARYDKCDVRLKLWTDPERGGDAMG